MHAATTFEILSDPAADIFATLTKEKRGQLRKMMIQSILMTDMASHFVLAKKLEGKVTGDVVSFQKDDGEDKQLLLDLIVHSADIGAQALPVPIANKWSYAVLKEFQEVHEAEKSAGVDLTPFIIGLDEPLRAANCQFGFINFIVKPLWSNLVKVVPDMADELMANLEGNVKYWKDAVYENTPKEKVATKDSANGETKDDGGSDNGSGETKESKSTEVDTTNNAKAAVEQQIQDEAPSKEKDLSKRKVADHAESKASENEDTATSEDKKRAAAL
jgi:hypothetical protein